MLSQTNTRPLAAEHPAVLAAHRAIRTAEVGADPTARTIYRAYRWAEAAGSYPGISDDRVDAVADQASLLWGMLARAPVETRSDALCKLEAVADSFERGERIDGTDSVMIHQVIAWLRSA